MCLYLHSWKWICVNVCNWCSVSSVFFSCVCLQWKSPEAYNLLLDMFYPVIKQNLKILFCLAFDYIYVILRNKVFLAQMFHMFAQKMASSKCFHDFQLAVCCTWYMHSFCQNHPVIMILANVQVNCNLVLFVFRSIYAQKKNLVSNNLWWFSFCVFIKFTIWLSHLEAKEGQCTAGSIHPVSCGRDCIGVLCCTVQFVFVLL